MLHMSDPEHRSIPKQSPPSTLRPDLSSLHRPSFIFDPDDVFQKYLISGEASTFITCDCSSLVPQRGPPK
ncbi:hypothetical protein CGCA056_v010605 [Colletotrichum aenigma]|uniref:uncharacterized protein n=1 Tax=Colletotrichum aenigma TaxID=1215731 RepID=UPI001873291E|nr:uncharacterized protein CGCA056_v010605 [Colletotrichum aenigma]KAF5517327.1 hypothetical protein CGCA056_v010605 [Colletotrichum aenigma]